MEDHSSGRVSFILSILCLFIPWPGIAQEKKSVAEIDSLSYKAYMAEDWKKVVEYTRSAFHSGSDNYNLRLWSGIAELNRHNPVRATIHFRKALEFKQDDPDALENLFSSMLFSGDLAGSRLLAAAYSPEFRKRLGIPAKRLITSAFIEPGYLFNSKAEELNAYRPDAELSQVYLVPTYWSLSAGINVEAGNRFSGTVSTNILSFAAVQQFLIQNLDPIIKDVPFDQRAFYLVGNYYLGHGFNLSLAGQFLSYTLPLYHWVPGDFGGDYVLDGFSYNDLAMQASAIKRFPYVTIGLAADVNRFKNQWIKQAEAEITIYPAGNVNTWLKIGGTWISDSSRIIAHASLGRKLFRTLSITGEYYYGDIYDFSERKASIVFNNFDVIRKRLEINLMASQLLPHLDVSLRYQYTLRSAVWQIYHNSEYIGNQLRNYPVHSFIGQLTWRF
jgi:hypothetical protein